MRTEIPGRPARPVRPDLWMYESTSYNQQQKYTIKYSKLINGHISYGSDFFRGLNFSRSCVGLSSGIL